MERVNHKRFAKQARAVPAKKALRSADSLQKQAVRHALHFWDLEDSSTRQLLREFAVQAPFQHHLFTVLVERKRCCNRVQRCVDLTLEQIINYQEEMLLGKEAELDESKLWYTRHNYPLLRLKHFAAEEEQCYRCARFK